MTISLVSLISIPIYSGPLLRLWRVKRAQIPSHYLFRYVIPISVGKVIAVVSAYFSLWKVPVSYAQTGTCIAFRQKVVFLKAISQTSSLIATSF